MFPVSVISLLNKYPAERACYGGNNKVFNVSKKKKKKKKERERKKRDLMYL